MTKQSLYVHPYEEKVETTPVFTFTLPSVFSKEPLASLLATLFGDHPFSLVMIKQRFLKQAFRATGLRCFAFHLHPVDEPAFLAIPIENLRQSCALFFQVQQIDPNATLDYELQDALFTAFLEKTALYLSQNGLLTPFNPSVSPDQTALPKGNQFHCEFQLTIGSHLHIPLHFFLPLSFCQTYQSYHSLHQAPSLPSHLSSLPIQGSFEIGHIELSSEELLSLRIGDYLIYHSSHDGVGKLCFENHSFFYAKKKEKGLVILEKIQPMDENAHYDENWEKLEQLPVTVSVEALRFQLPLEAIASLHEGDLIEQIKIDPAAPLTLCVKGKPFAKAELTEKQGHVLLRIISLSGHDGQDS